MKKRNYSAKNHFFEIFKKGFFNLYIRNVIYQFQRSSCYNINWEHNLKVNQTLEKSGKFWGHIFPVKLCVCPIRVFVKRIAVCVIAHQIYR